MDVSVVVPVYNEQESLPHLYRQLLDALAGTKRAFEIILVDDGSTDASRECIRELAARDNRVKLIVLRRNFGQTAAMQAGLQHAEGEVIVTLDADLQNDPADIPLLIEHIEQGYDLVHGWRQEREDAWLSRKLPSLVANWLIARATRFPIHDLGCTLKAVRREIAKELELYGEMHRFIPILAHQRGARCKEVVTRHHPRLYGKSKYGMSRTLRVLLDLITVKFLLEYFASPMKLFGAWGIACTCLAGVSGVATILMKFIGNVDMTGNPLLLLTAFSGMAGMQLFSLGLLGEVAARIYYAVQPRQNYSVRELVNFGGPGRVAA